MADSFVIKRSVALGDVILATPVLRRLRRENPDAFIQVMTYYPEVFTNSPHLSAKVKHPANPLQLIDLDGAYEARPEMHIVRAYMQAVFGDPGEPGDLQQELWFRSNPFRNTGKWIAVHASVAGWKNRTLPRETWRNVVIGLCKLGFEPFLVGTSRDALYGTLADSIMLDRSLAVQAAFIGECVAFVGGDSALLHVAGATEVPIVGVFTCARPETRLPWRHGEPGWKCEVVQPDLPCVGCLARRAPPVTVEHCERGDMICVERVSAIQIVDAVQNIIQRKDSES